MWNNRASHLDEVFEFHFTRLPFNKNIFTDSDSRQPVWTPTCRAWGGRCHREPCPASSCASLWPSWRRRWRWRGWRSVPQWSGTWWETQGGGGADGGSVAAGPSQWATSKNALQHLLVWIHWICWPDLGTFLTGQLDIFEETFPVL